MIARFRTQYGAAPLHLIGHVIAFVIFVWAFSQILGGGFVINYVGWFVGAAVLHDIVAVPLYSLLNRAASVTSDHVLTRAARPVINHLRLPAMISAILLLVYFPVILGPAGKNYRNDTGHPLHGYLRNWLLITVGLYVISGLIYATRSFHTRLLLDTAILAEERERQASARAVSADSAQRPPD